MKWNPNAPNSAGLEFFASQYELQQLPILSSVGQTYRGAEMVADASTENIESVLLHLNPYTAGSTDGVLGLGVDVYDETAAFGADTAVALRVPGVTGTTHESGWNAQCTDVSSFGSCAAFSAATAYTYVNEKLTPIISDTSGIALAVPNSLQSINFQTTSSSFDSKTGSSISLAGKRITEIAVFARFWSESSGNARAHGGLWIGGAFTGDFMGTAGQNIPANAHGLRLQWAYQQNPVTNQEWTLADLAAFVNGGANFFGVSVGQVGGAGTIFLMSINLRVKYANETRIATGYMPSTPLGQQWVEFSLVSPADNTTPVTPAKTNGHKMLVVPFIADTGGKCNWHGVSQAATAETQAAANGLQTASFEGSPAPVVNALSPGFDARAMTCLFRKASGATISTDGQPYERVQADTCKSGTDLQQIFHSEGALTYGTFQLLLQVTSDGKGGTLQTLPLTVTLKAVAGGATLAGPATINPTDIGNDGLWHVVKSRFASGVALSAGQAVFLDLSTSDPVGYQVMGAWALFDPTAPTTLDNDAATASQGSTTDHGTNGAGSDTHFDYPWTIGIIPTPPGGLATTLRSIGNQPAGLVGTAFVPLIYYAWLTWTPTALGAAFDHYEIWDNDIHLIAVITAEAIGYFADFECKRNVSHHYEIRVVSTDGTSSAFANFPSITVPLSGTCNIVLVTNQNPPLSLAAFDENPTSQHRLRQYAEPFQTTRPGTSKRLLRNIYGRQMPLAFRPVERGGDQFVRNLVIAANDPKVADGTVPAGRVMFDPILALTEDPTLPYIAVCDQNGRRWLADVAASIVTQEEPGSIYYATCAVNEVSSIPAPVITSLPWHF